MILLLCACVLFIYAVFVCVCFFVCMKFSVCNPYIMDATLVARAFPLSGL